MSFQFLRLLSLLALSLGFTVPMTAEAADALATRGQQRYDKEIFPLLEKYCLDCHSDDVTKGDFDLTKHKNYAEMRGDMTFWDHIRQQVTSHVMPPEKKAQPTLQERDQLVAWIDDSVFWFDPVTVDVGRATYSRLNRNEYNNTVRDLLKVDSRPASQFPPDDTGYGFDNIGEVLAVSPMLMEKYLRASRQITDKAMEVAAPGHIQTELPVKNFWNHKGTTKEDNGIRWFFSNAEARTKVKTPTTGTYLISVRVAATEAGNEPARIALSADNQDLGTFDVKTRFKDANEPWQVIRTYAKLKGGEAVLGLSFLNDFAEPANPDPNKRDRNLALQEVIVEGPMTLLPPRSAKFLNWLTNGRPVAPPALLLSGEDFTSGEGETFKDTGAISLASNGYVKRPVEITTAGKYRFALKVGAQQAGKDPAKFDVRLAGKTIGVFDVTAKNQAPQSFSVEAELPAGSHELQVWFLNDYYEPDTKADRNLWVHQVRLEGPLNEKNNYLAAAEVPDLVTRMGNRLFRRPMREDEKTLWLGLAQMAMKEGESPLGSLRYVLEGMLSSSGFLFRVMPQPTGPVQHGAALIDEYSLASRLSYFIWSSPPDDRLLQLAEKGELRKNLAAEVKRMIADWRGWYLTENFAGQWLQLRDMDIAAPDAKMFPEFRGGTGYMMKQESQYYFDHILRENRSILEFLNSDYTFLNEKLARYYGIKNVKGDKFQKVSLQGTPRGGILTNGSILTLTSNSTRTSPVKRGKFLLENLLGTPPPPAPANVPPLDEQKAHKSNQTLREQFAAHRSNPACAGCHAFLDPMGFAFENYDAIGRWRDTEKNHPIDASGHLVRGQEFKDLAELRQILVRDNADGFTRSLSENLLIYALGRGIHYPDKVAVNEIARRTKEAGYHFQDMILAVCESAPFQKMQIEAPKN